MAEDKCFDIYVGSKSTFNELIEKYHLAHSIKKSGDIGIKRDYSASRYLGNIFGGFKLNEINSILSESSSEQIRRGYDKSRNPLILMVAREGLAAPTRGFSVQPRGLL